jgi:L-rhamnose mutarotase
MQRIAFRLRVREGRVDDYTAIHTEVWPELLADLSDAGIQNYSIFADGEELFAYLECDDWEAAQATLAKSDANRRWQAAMQDYLATPVNPDEDASLAPLPCVFHLD